MAAHPVPIKGDIMGDIIAHQICKARAELLLAMGVADKLGKTDLHRRIGYEILSLDDLKAEVEERSAE